jgi:hypothetical protein
MDQLRGGFVTCDFAFAWPTCLHPSSLTQDEFDENQQTVIGLFRKLRFRRIMNKAFFAYALIDSTHPSRSLAADEDWDNPAPAHPTDALLFLFPTSALLTSLTEPSASARLAKYSVRF